MISLISGEFDSPVASYLMLRQGHELEFIHFDSQPFNDKMPLVKSKRSIVALKRNFGMKSKFILNIVPHDKLLTAFMDKCNIKNIYILFFCNLSIIKST